MDSLHLNREDGVLEVTLDRPPANAIDLATSRAMGEVFADFRDDPELVSPSCERRATSSSAPAGTSRRPRAATTCSATTAWAASAGSSSCRTSTSRSSLRSTGWPWAAASSWPSRAT